MRSSLQEKPTIEEYSFKCVSKCVLGLCADMSHPPLHKLGKDALKALNRINKIER